MVFTKDGAFGYRPLEDLVELQKDVRRWYFHNGVADRPALNKLIPGFNMPLEKMWDTVVMSRLFNQQRPGGHSVENWATILGGEQKVKHEDWSQLTPEMIERCRSDTRLGLKITKELLEKEGKGFSIFSIRLEHDTARGL